MYYVVAAFRQQFLANICQDAFAADRLKHDLEKEGIPCFAGYAQDVSSADPRLQAALGQT